MKTLVGKRTRTIKFLSRKRGVYTHSYIQHSSLSQFRTFVKCREMPKSANQHFCQKNVCQKHNFPQQHMHCLQRQKFQSKQKPHTQVPSKLIQPQSSRTQQLCCLLGQGCASAVHSSAGVPAVGVESPLLSPRGGRWLIKRK